MAEKKLLRLVEAEGRGMTPTSWWWELKGTVHSQESPNVRCWRREANRAPFGSRIAMFAPR
jgi:hypothetical protein